MQQLVTFKQLHKTKLSAILTPMCTYVNLLFNCTQIHVVAYVY